MSISKVSESREIIKLRETKIHLQTSCNRILKGLNKIHKATGNDIPENYFLNLCTDREIDNASQAIAELLDSKYVAKYFLNGFLYLSILNKGLL